MQVKIGQTSFDRVRYDMDGDVLYLHSADPASAVEFRGAKEGHALRYDAEGRLIGITLLNARWPFEREGEVRITFPDGDVLIAGPDELTPVLAPAKSASWSRLDRTFRPGMSLSFCVDAQVKGEGSMRFVIYEDNAGEWRWRLVDGNNKIVGDSGEGYESKSNVRRAIENVQGECGGAAIEEE